MTREDRPLKWRPILITVLVIVSFGVGMWVGEEGRWSVWALGAALSCGAAGAFVAAGPSSRRLRVALLTTFFCVTGIYIGTQSFAHAFNECVQRGEELRVSLAQHYARTAQYPRSLHDLPQSSTRCERWLRGSILRYESTQAGYPLSFSDWLVSHEATDAEPFMAHK